MNIEKKIKFLNQKTVELTIDMNFYFRNQKKSNLQKNKILKITIVVDVKLLFAYIYNR